MKATQPAGYSGTPLAKKLGYADGTVVVASGAPTGFKTALGPLPAVRFANEADAATDIAHAFVTKRSDLAAQLGKIAQRREITEIELKAPKQAIHRVIAADDHFDGRKSEACFVSDWLRRFADRSLDRRRNCGLEDGQFGIAGRRHERGHDGDQPDL